MVSPILSNIFLHYVLDEWFEREVQPRLKGRSFLIRYADDFVAWGFYPVKKTPARVMEVLPKRFEKYGLTIHPDKTKLVPFERPQQRPMGGAFGVSRHLQKSFDLAGLHALSIISASNGNCRVFRRLSGSRFQPRRYHALSDWCRVNRHLLMTFQHRYPEL